MAQPELLALLWADGQKGLERKLHCQGVAADAPRDEGSPLVHSFLCKKHNSHWSCCAASVSQCEAKHINGSESHRSTELKVSVIPSPEKRRLGDLEIF